MKAALSPACIGTNLICLLYALHHIKLSLKNERDLVIKKQAQTKTSKQTKM